MVLSEEEWQTLAQCAYLILSAELQIQEGTEHLGQNYIGSGQKNWKGVIIKTEQT